MVTPILGLAMLFGVLAVAFTERASVKLSYLDWHAAAVVFGGVLGSLFVAIDSKSLLRTLYSVAELFPSTSIFSRQMQKSRLGLEAMSNAWRDGRRATVLDMADNAPTEELRVAADALLRQQKASALEESFTRLRTQYYERYTPIVEAWELVGKLAPSFGMVGTVSGMVQLFRNMGENSGNLGGAMAMALLATLYGIAVGAAVGGPMATRITTQLNDRLALLLLMEKTVAALVDEGEASGSGTAG